MNNGDVGGSRGRGRGWQQPDNQPRELRRPRNVADNPNVVEPLRSNLSPEAKEWYPPNYNPHSAAASYVPDPVQYRPQRPSVQGRLRQAQDGDPYNLDGMSYCVEEIENINLRNNISNLISVMCEITFDPGKFDTLCGPLVDTFAPTLNNAIYTRALVDAIVNQSIAEPNFRYNGARLCSMYDSVGSAEDSEFHSCLLNRCLFEESKILDGIESSEENIRGYAMFLAEIYTQLESHQGGRIKALAESLCKIFLKLLHTNKEVNIKAVCQLLKLAGLALDADCPHRMHDAFELLKQHSGLPCVRNLIELRRTRWGISDLLHSHLNGSTSPSEGTPAVGAEGGFLADGQTLTSEERAFLQSNLPPAKDQGQLDNDILEELENESWETGMDPEMQESFLEFLKMSKQIK